ncbi:TlpA family protein disulfide reductase [Daejeonella oryzae]|uniref:TlpA family protein disulfide reductase n=1 Tax=Daejeonella oryzae TaxID=1122943 RepID=UPI00041131DE|nr:TlpA disulfide reductase family protein [Daejeonella oryzae]
MRECKKYNTAFFTGLLILISFAINAEAKTFGFTGIKESEVYNFPITRNSATHEKTGDIYPEISFANALGNKINLSELKGKVVFINFWATWCLPCRVEMPSINTLYKKYKDDKSIVFIMVDADNKLKSSQKYMDKRRFELPVFEAVSSIPEEIFNGTLPATLIIDKYGRIVFKHEGMARYDKPEMMKFIEDLKNQ